MKPDDVKEKLEKNNIPSDMSTVALIDDQTEKAYIKSTAVIMTF